MNFFISNKLYVQDTFDILREYENFSHPHCVADSKASEQWGWESCAKWFIDNQASPYTLHIPKKLLLIPMNNRENRNSFRVLAAILLLFEMPIIIHTTNISAAPSSAIVKMPEQVAFHEDGKDYVLSLTGTAVRKKLIFKIYNVAHYMEKNTDKSAILADGPAKQLVIRYSRNISGDLIRADLLSDFRLNATPTEYQEIQPLTEKLLAFFSKSVLKNDELIIRWLPGGQIKVYFNAEKKGVVTNTTFARVLWSIWFGPHAAVNPSGLTARLH